MRAMFLAFAVGLAPVLLVGCAQFQAPVMPPVGLIYNNQQAPMFSGSATGSKTGEASASSVLAMFGWGDCSIRAAAKAGQITEIRHVDYRYENVLGIHQKFTTIVNGE